MEIYENLFEKYGIVANLIENEVEIKFTKKLYINLDIFPNFRQEFKEMVRSYIRKCIKNEETLFLIKSQIITLFVKAEYINALSYEKPLNTQNYLELK